MLFTLYEKLPQKYNKNKVDKITFYVGNIKKKQSKNVEDKKVHDPCSAVWYVNILLPLQLQGIKKKIIEQIFYAALVYIYFISTN